MPMGVKTLLLKNQYLLDLHHKNDNQNTYQKWRNIVERGEIQGLQAIKVNQQPAWYNQEDLLRPSSINRSVVERKPILKTSVTPAKPLPTTAQSSQVRQSEKSVRKVDDDFVTRGR